MPISQKSLANLRPTQRGQPSPRKGITCEIHRLADKFRADMLKAWRESKGYEVLCNIINTGSPTDQIQALKLIASVIPKQLTIDKQSSDTRLTITANVSQPIPITTTPNIITITPDKS